MPTTRKNLIKGRVQDIAADKFQTHSYLLINYSSHHSNFPDVSQHLLKQRQQLFRFNKQSNGYSYRLIGFCHMTRVLDHVVPLPRKLNLILL